MLFKLIRFYKSLKIQSKRIIQITTCLIISYLIYKTLFPNPNNWTKINDFDIKIPLAFEYHGIDISHHNGEINWGNLKEAANQEVKLSFVFIKATEGTSLTDKQFKRNWEAAKKHKMIRGAYHYYIPWRDPESQFKIFTKTVRLSSGDLPPVLDIEENSLRPDKKIIEDLGKWLKMIENHYGIKPIIYTNQSFFNKFIKGNFENYPLWIADYTRKTLTLYDEEKLHFWQYSKSGKLDGIKGDVDFNSYLKTKDEFLGLLK